MGKNKNREPKDREPKDTCNHCDEVVPVNGETAYGVQSSRVNFGQYVLNTCVACGNDTRLFTDEGGLDFFVRRGGIEVQTIDEIPGVDYLERYLDLMAIPLPEQHELTAEQETEVAKFGLYLQAAEVDSRDFE